MDKILEVNKKRKFRYYNNGVETKRFYEDEEVPHGWALGNLSLLNRTPWNKGLSAKTSNYYKNAIYTWTDLDVRKVKIAKENNLNFVAIYNYQA